MKVDLKIEPLGVIFIGLAQQFFILKKFMATWLKM